MKKHLFIISLLYFFNNLYSMDNLKAKASFAQKQGAEASENNEPAPAAITSAIVTAAAQSVTASNQTACPVCRPVDQNPLRIFKSPLFNASLDHRDARVPRVFVQTHAHVASLSDWTSAHWLEFGALEKALENSLRKTFNADLVNVACLMNLAGQEGTHTHWHFITRLANPVIAKWGNEIHIYQDPCYGKPYDMNGKNYRTATATMQIATIKAIQQNLDLSIVHGGALKIVKD